MCLKKFSPEFFKVKQSPQYVFDYKINENSCQQDRLNHLLLKNPHDDFVFPDFISEHVKDFVLMCYGNAIKNISDTANRFVYLTFDNKRVLKNKTQRDAGFHIDGMQGSEVPTLVNNCFQYVWCDKLPMSFAHQEFNINNLDRFKYNYFKALERQVDIQSLKKIDSGKVYFMNPYMVHRSEPSAVEQNRLFMRVYFSHLPITSTKATINPLIKYIFDYHSTTGNIPPDLL